MIGSDRVWTSVIAECGLDRAQPVLATLAPTPFARVNLAHALAASGLVPDRETSFADTLRPALLAALGPDAPAVFRALERLCLDDTTCPATVFWRVRMRELHGAHAPDIPDWAAFVQVFRGRADPFDTPDWLAEVAAGVHAHRDLTALVTRQRSLPLTALDRSLYVRFGWNDDGEVPGLTGLLNAAALLRVQSAWRIAAPRFDAAAQSAIEAAAGRLAAAERSAAMATLDDDARRLGVSRDQFAAAFHPVRPVPPLSAILTEAA